MALARCNFAVTDEDGAVVHGASIEVRRETTGALAAVYSDRAGATSLGNPFIAADGADAGFHVIGGAYKITATKGGFQRTWRYVPVGLAQEADFTTEGWDTSREPAAAAEIDVLPADVILYIDTSSAPTTVNIPLAAERSGQPVVIKDKTGNANSNPITPAFTGGELCDGQAGSSFQITTPYGWVRFTPRTGAYAMFGGQL